MLWIQNAVAVIPTHFGEKLEAMLACRSEWSTAYWEGYFQTYLGPPLRYWGEAAWFPAQQATVAGVPLKEVFVNQRSSTALMVGAWIAQPVDVVKKQIESQLGEQFTALPGPYSRYLSHAGSVLVGLSNRQTKWYCARWNLGNRP